MRSLIMAVLLSAVWAAEPVPDEAPRPMGGQASDAGGIGPGGKAIEGAGARSGEKSQTKPLERGPATTAPKAAGGGGEAAGSGPGFTPPVWNPKELPPPAGSSCAVTPPKLNKIGVVIHNRPNPGKLIMDSTPKVCDRDFCSKVGFEGRGCCPLGPEGSDARISCELFVLGTDPSDGVAGPHWIFQGSGSISKHPENPFLAIVKFTPGTAGVVTACSNRKPIVCTSIKVP